MFVEGRTRAEGRVSGRVIDERGRPIANAEVRLADGSSGAGRLMRTISDDAGGFTLSGLRPGARYTLVAISGDEELSGREIVEAPDTRVEIALSRASGIRDDDSPRRVGRASQRFESDSYDDEGRHELDDLRRPAVNEDDLPDVSANDDERFEDTRELTSAASAAWRAAATAAQNPPQTAGSTEFEDPASSQSPASDPLEREARNPLPPARERLGDSADRSSGSTSNAAAGTNPPAGSSSERPSEPFTSGEAPLVTDFGSFDTKSVPAAQSKPNPEASQAPGGPFPAQSEAVTRPPFDLPTPEAAAAPEANDRGEPLSPSEVETPTTSEPTPAAQGEHASMEPVASEPSDFVRESEHAGPDETPNTAGDEARLDSPRRPTWRELAEQSAVLPAASGSPARSVRRAPLEQEAGQPKRALASGNQPAQTTRQAVRSSCKYDARAKRVVDFQLADLDGGAVKFADIDSDYILLDFWGTWCSPCIKSIPHLIDLQGRYDPERVQVVGIAYETGPVESRDATVRRAADQLGINYPILMAETDGKPCPLAAALNVQAYPTLILLDRSGKILWRDSGSGEQTLSRLDRVIATAARTDSSTVRR
jgi:thiol-disulfide isomerase/thioredoxin